MLIPFRLMVHIGIKIRCLQLLVHFDSVSFFQYLRRILASLLPICICVADNPILFVIFLGFWTLVYSGLNVISIVFDVTGEVVQEPNLGDVRAYPLIDCIDVLLREKAFLLAILLSLSLDLCCIKIFTRYGFNAFLYFLRFAFFRVHILRLFHEVDTIVRVNHLIAHFILVDRDSYGLIECAQ